jgi:hypothetical protein
MTDEPLTETTGKDILKALNWLVCLVAAIAVKVVFA